MLAKVTQQQLNLNTSSLLNNSDVCMVMCLNCPPPKAIQSPNGYFKTQDKQGLYSYSKNIFPFLFAYWNKEVLLSCF